MVAGCAAPGHIGSGNGPDFERVGRFSVSVHEPDGKQDAVQGGFAWLDTGERLTLDLTNPLGNTLARVTVSDSHALLRRSDGSQEYADSADALVQQVLGSPVPVQGLRDWLRGKTGRANAAQLQADAQGRVTSFVQQGWRVQLSRYDNIGPTLLQLGRTDAGRRVNVRLAVSARAN